MLLVMHCCKELYVKALKRIFVCAALAFALAGAFCADLNQSVLASVSAFLNDGKFLLYRTNSEAVYYPRSSISQIWVDEDTLAIFWLDTGNDYEVKKITLKNVSVKVDERKNLIVEKK